MELTKFAPILVKRKNALSEIVFTCTTRKTVLIFKVHLKQTSKNKNLLLIKLLRKT